MKTHIYHCFPTGEVTVRGAFFSRREKKAEKEKSADARHAPNPALLARLSGAIRNAARCSLQAFTIEKRRTETCIFDFQIKKPVKLATPRPHSHSAEWRKGDALKAPRSGQCPPPYKICANSVKPLDFLDKIRYNIT